MDKNPNKRLNPSEVILGNWLNNTYLIFGVVKNPLEQNENDNFLNEYLKSKSDVVDFVNNIKTIFNLNNLDRAIKRSTFRNASIINEKFVKQLYLMCDND